MLAHSHGHSLYFLELLAVSENYTRELLKLISVVSAARNEGVVVNRDSDTDASAESETEADLESYLDAYLDLDLDLDSDSDPATDYLDLDLDFDPDSDSDPVADCFDLDFDFDPVSECDPVLDPDFDTDEDLLELLSDESLVIVPR